MGNRPQLIKLDREFKQVLVYTGQHYDNLMKDIFFKGLKLPKPDYDLGETKLGKMIDKIMVVLEKEKPDYVIVYGDTRSTLAGAVAAYYQNIPIIHIEAGCRSFNTKMVEERIRTLVDEISTIHLTPSTSTKEYLERDGKKLAIYSVGATQIDTMYETFPTTKHADAYKYRVATIHRDSNLNSRCLNEIFAAFSKSDMPIRLYIHPNTEKIIAKEKIKIPKTVKIRKPISYKKMINEISFADKVITDSGGMQVEAFFLRVPCITLRNETEWTETVDTKWNVLTGYNTNRILEYLNKTRWRGNGSQYEFGGGDAKKKIRMILNNL